MKNEESVIYQVKDLFFSYSLGNQDVEAIRGISLEISRHSLVTISGPSGSGKSTLLNILGLIEPIQGEGSFFKMKISARWENEERTRFASFI